MWLSAWNCLPKSWNFTIPSFKLWLLQRIFLSIWTGKSATPSYFTKIRDSLYSGQFGSLWAHSLRFSKPPLGLLFLPDHSGASNGCSHQLSELKPTSSATSCLETESVTWLDGSFSKDYPFWPQQIQIGMGPQINLKLSSSVNLEASLELCWIWLYRTWKDGNQLLLILDHCMELGRSLMGLWKWL